MVEVVCVADRGKGGRHHSVMKLLYDADRGNSGCQHCDHDHSVVEVLCVADMGKSGCQHCDHDHSIVEVLCVADRSKGERHH